MNKSSDHKQNPEAIHENMRTNEAVREKLVHLPPEYRNKITNRALPLIARVDWAESIRRSHGISQVNMAHLIGISIGQYQLFVRLFRSGRHDLISSVESGEISAHTAVRRLMQPENRPYPFLAKYRDMPIIYQDGKILVYRVSDGIRIHKARRFRGEILESKYLFDDITCAVATIVDVLRQADEGECFISTALKVKDSTGNPCGDLRHRFIAAYIKCAPESLYKYPIREANPALVDGAHDWRIRNMYCPPLNGIVPGLYCKAEIDESDEEIDLIYNGLVTILDKTPEMLHFLRTHAFHPEGRGNGRIVVEVRPGHSVYLYRLVLASNMCGGLPDTDDEILAMMERFNSDWAEYEVDHLNGVAQDCRLRNLILLSPQNNIRKQKLQSKLKRYNRKYYAEAVRFDETHVRYSEGYRDGGNKIFADKDIVLSIEEYLEALSAFVSKIENKERTEEKHG